MVVVVGALILGGVLLARGVPLQYILVGAIVLLCPAVMLRPNQSPPRAADIDAAVLRGQADERLASPPIDRRNIDLAPGLSPTSCGRDEHCGPARRETSSVSTLTSYWDTGGSIKGFMNAN